jgi:hypothetical protein
MCLKIQIFKSYEQHYNGLRCRFRVWTSFLPFRRGVESRELGTPRQAEWLSWLPIVLELLRSLRTFLPPSHYSRIPRGRPCSRHYFRTGRSQTCSFAPVVCTSIRHPPLYGGGQGRGADFAGLLFFTRGRIFGQWAAQLVVQRARGSAPLTRLLQVNRAAPAIPARPQEVMRRRLCRVSNRFEIFCSVLSVLSFFA